MKSQSRSEQSRTEAYVVVDPVRWIAVLVQPWHMRAYPYTDIRKPVGISGQCIWFVMIDRRCPINGQATQDEAQKDWHVQPVAAPHQQVVPVNYKHAALTHWRTWSDGFLIELGDGMWHKCCCRYPRRCHNSSLTVLVQETFRCYC